MVSSALAILIAVYVLRLRIRQIQKDKGMENTNDASNSTNSNTTVAINSNSNENNTTGREGREGEGRSMEVNQQSRYNDFSTRTINNATPSNNGSLTAVHPAMQQQQQGLGRVRSTRSQIVHNIHEEHRKSQIGKSSIKF